MANNAGLHCHFCGAALEALTVACPSCAAQPTLGERYEIRANIGRGGMGEVFLGYDRRLANEVAIKRLTPQFSASPELRESLMKEARIMARLSDSAIVRLFDLAEFYGDSYLILEYVCGPSLRELIRGGYRASPFDLVHLMGEISRGLTTAHQAGVIHRDLKPSNMLLALEGVDRMAFVASRQLPGSVRTARVKIADFGIAKAIADSGSTMTNAFSGTPGYMAPEQFRGETPSPETDVYALGVITCELLTGKLPNTPLMPLEGVHPAVMEVVAKAMAPERGYRFASAASFHEALCNAIEGRSPVRPIVIPAAPPWSNARRMALVSVLVLAVLCTIGFFALLTTPKPQKTREIARTPFQMNEGSIAIEWHSPPRIEVPPPVIEDARGRVPEKGLQGPDDPKVKWTIILSTSSMRVGAVGVDGTVYLSSHEGVCAVRDGKLKWSYKAGVTGPSDVRIDENGLLWYRTFDATYCLNRDGKGGRLPESYPAPKGRADAPYVCRGDQTLRGPKWKLELDGGCTSAGVASGVDGQVYVATDLPQILAVTPNGAVKWKRPAPCNATALIPTLANRLVFACENNTLYGLTGETETWKRKSDGRTNSKMLTDSTGRLFFGDSASISGATHVHAVDVDGKDVWTVDMQRATVTDVVLGAKKRLFVVGSYLYSRVVCLED